MLAAGVGVGTLPCQPASAVIGTPRSINQSRDARAVWIVRLMGLTTMAMSVSPSNLRLRLSLRP